MFKNFHSVCTNCTRLFLNLSKVNNVNHVGGYSSCMRSLERCYSTANVNVVPLVKQTVKIDNNVSNSEISLKEHPTPKDFISDELHIEDVSDYAPAVTSSFNFAAYVNNSPTLQEFVKLNVNLHKLEKHKDVLEFMLKLDFEKDVKQYITFLHDNGVLAEELGPFITYNPLILKEDLDNLQIRMNYMHSKKFTSDMIARIITKNPRWLSFTTKQIDSKLGYFQLEFKLSGNEVRCLTTKQPRLITYDIRHLKRNIFSFKEEMGFNVVEMKKILLDKPRLFLACKEHIVERFSYVHNVMKVNHEIIAKQPEVLTSRLFRIKQRHLFLKSLGLAQYDPTKPNYASLTSLITGTDSEFCRDVAKTSVSTFNLFQKTS